MTDEIDFQVDPNTADLEQLKRLPGVGPTLAQRILEARPFFSAEDMSRVEGIGGSVLENLRPYVAINAQKSEAATVQAALAPAYVGLIEAESDAEPDETDFEESQAELDQALLEEEAIFGEQQEEEEADFPHGVEAAIAALPTGEQQAEAEADEDHTQEAEAAEAPRAAQPAAGTRAPARQPAYITQGQAVLLAFASGLLALLLGLALSLGIVAGVNQGRLQFASPAQVNNLSVRLDGLSADADTLAGDLEGLRARVGNLEALSGRVSEVEQAAEALSGDLEATAAQVEGLDSQLTELGAQVETLETDNERFGHFLDGLRGLMEQLFEQPGDQE